MTECRHCGAISDVRVSNYVDTWGLLGGLPTTPEQDIACFFLESKGQKFCIDFGYDNAERIAESYAEWRKPGRA